MLNQLPLLTILVLAPAATGLLLWPWRNARATRWLALGGALLGLLLSLVVLGIFDPSLGEFQLIDTAPWIPSLNVHYRLGVDGISVLFLPLTALLFVAVIISSWRRVRVMPRLYYSLLLLLESSVLGIFLALDTMLFFLFWELTLIPFYFLISLYGIGPQRRYAAVKYTMFMLMGGVPLLFAFVVLAFNHAEVLGVGIPAGLSFDYRQLLDTPLADGGQLLVFLLLLTGFAVKTPLFPLHTWLPVTAMEGPISVAALMTGLKLGAYGLIRFAVPLAPAAAQDLHWLLAGLGVTGVIYGALAAMAQTNLRAMLAYSSLSHVGMVVLGIASFNLQGLQGALLLTLNFIVAAGGLFLVSGYLHLRTGSSDLASLGGVTQSMPLLASAFFLFGLAGMGVPGTSSFPAEFLILVSALQTHTGAGLAALFGLILGAGYFLQAYRRAFLGTAWSDAIRQAADLQSRELLVVALLTVFVLAAGLYPFPLLEITRTSAEVWIGRLAPLP